MKSSRLKYFGAAISSTAMWGFFSIPLRNLQDYPSEQILQWRIITSLIITWLVILLFRRRSLASDRAFLRKQSPEGRKRIITLIFLAGVLITGNWYSFIYAVNHVSLKSAAFAYMVCPLLTAMGGFLILKEHLTPLKLTAIGIACISILILSRGSLRDVCWSVFVASLYAFYLIIQRVVRDLDKFNMLGIQLLLSLILTLPLFISQGAGIPDAPEFWINILVISVVFTIIPLFLSLYALVGIPSSTMGIIIYVNPVIAFAVAILYFGEEINTLQALAYSLLVVAVIIFNSGFISGLISSRYRKTADNLA
ncbi:MAG TPA: EamA family transporter [Sphingobacteriaceae bacterium]